MAWHPHITHLATLNIFELVHACWNAVRKCYLHLGQPSIDMWPPNVCVIPFFWSAFSAFLVSHCFVSSVEFPLNVEGPGSMLLWTNKPEGKRKRWNNKQIRTTIGDHNRNSLPDPSHPSQLSNPADSLASMSLS